MKPWLILSILLLPISASAQQALPITLSGQEYEALVQAIAQRDPVISALMHKQAEAQQAAKAKPSEAPATPPTDR